MKQQTWPEAPLTVLTSVLEISLFTHTVWQDPRLQTGKSCLGGRYC